MRFLSYRDAKSDFNVHVYYTYIDSSEYTNAGKFKCKVWAEIPSQRVSNDNTDPKGKLTIEL